VLCKCEALSSNPILPKKGNCKTYGMDTK
jgi:hypothetical protein